jgi:hypothetical protein
VNPLRFSFVDPAGDRASRPTELRAACVDCYDAVVVFDQGYAGFVPASHSELSDSIALMIFDRFGPSDS